MRIAFIGQPGSQSEGASIQYGGIDMEPVHCDSFEAIFNAVEQNNAEQALLPIENSLAGSIHGNYDLLLKYNLHIVGEVNFRVRHNLLALPGVKISDITRVLSHPQALAQCDNYLRSLGVKKEATSDTTVGVRRVVAENLRDAAAIATRRASEIHGLSILAADIEDDTENYTRFLVLAKDAMIPTLEQPTKTSIVFSLENKPGALYKAISYFALQDINLTKIESRPLRERKWEYFFYLDFAANQREERAQQALSELEDMTTFLRILGTYPQDLA